jgi:hypothetical protein
MNPFIGIIIGILITGVFLGLAILGNSTDDKKDPGAKKLISYIAVALMVILILYVIARDN